MTLMIILICLAVQRYMHLDIILQRRSLFDRYVGFMHKIFATTPLWQGIWGVITLLVPPVFLVALINHLLQGWFFNFFKFFFDLFILLYCLNAPNLRKQLSDYFQAYSRGDQQAAYYQGLMLVKQNPEKETPENFAHVVRAITQAIFLDANQHTFAVIFWYVILGPVGAVLYYLVNRIVFSTKQNKAELMTLKLGAEQFQGVLDWIPVRLLGLTYALAGHFSNAFSKWLRNLRLPPSKSEEFIMSVGLSALDSGETELASAQLNENYSALALVDRSLVIWIVVIAIFTMGAWIS